MTFPTQPAYIHTGSWNESSRSHPALKWMEQYTNAIDAKAWDCEPYSNWVAEDHTLTKSTGEVVSGGFASWAALSKEVYAPFSSHLHDPYFAVTWENDNGWEMIGAANLYWNLAAPGDGAKVKDSQGKEWDGKGPAAFKFRYVKQADGGIKMGSTEIFADPTAAVVTMLKRGMMSPEDLIH